MAVVTRWFWVRHAPVINPDHIVYGASDMPVDVSETHMFAPAARALPRGEDVHWLTSTAGRTHRTRDVVQIPGRLPSKDFRCDRHRDAHRDRHADDALCRLLHQVEDDSAQQTGTDDDAHLEEIRPRRGVVVRKQYATHKAWTDEHQAIQATAGEEQEDADDDAGCPGIEPAKAPVARVQPGHHVVHRRHTVSLHGRMKP